MPRIDTEYKRHLEATIKGMDTEYEYIKSFFKELSQYIIPRRYQSLDEGKVFQSKARNKYILDGFATRAVNTLSSGMLFGATNPTHRWVKLSLDTQNVRAQQWVDHVVETTLATIRRSNAYTSLPVMYKDLGVFGTSAMLIYDDPKSIIRTYTVPAGEYRLMRNEREEIAFFCRKYKMTAQQLVARFGANNVSHSVRQQVSVNTNDRFQEYDVYHLIEPNNPPLLPQHFAYRECFWELGGEQDMILAINGYYEKPFVAPRWEVLGNTVFGNSPGMEALPDIIGLQALTKQKAIGLAKLVNPPVVADQALKNQPTALMAGGITYASNIDGIGVKPVFQVNLPVSELREDVVGYYEAIGQFFFTDLFRAILDLSTVRSATEVQAATAEKLVLLGPVVNRTEDEALNDFVRRVIGIQSRRGMIQNPPPEAGGRIRLEYDSILSGAQKAAGINNIERFLGSVGQIAPVSPETLDVVNFNEAIREYGDRLNVPARIMRTRAEVQQIAQQRAEIAEQQREAEVGATLAGATADLAQAGAVQ